MENFEKQEKAFIIREASQADAEGVGHVQAETWLATYPNEAHGITREDVESAMAKRLQTRTEHWRNVIEGKTGDRRVWVAKDDQEGIVGFSSAQKGVKENKINAIYVLPDAQGKGTGQKLLKEALEWLESDKAVSLSVAKYNEDAIAFYKKFGFEEAGEIVSSDVARLPSGKVIPEIKMIKSAAVSK